MTTVGKALYIIYLKIFQMIVILKNLSRTSTKNMDPDGLMHLRVNNPFNQIIRYLNINSFRNKIDDLHIKFAKIFN